jgi:glycine dehydrogenase
MEVRICNGTEALENECFGVLLQYPGANGDIRDYREYAAAIHAKGGMVIAAADLLALT